MDNLPGWVIPAIVIAVIVLLLLIVLGAVSSSKRRKVQEENDRRRAAEIREEAQNDRLGVEERELQARESALEADKARLEAERKQQLAQEHRSSAQEARHDIDSRLREADELDPDTDPSRRDDGRRDATRRDAAGTAGAAGTVRDRDHDGVDDRHEHDGHRDHGVDHENRHDHDGDRHRLDLDHDGRDDLGRHERDARTDGDAQSFGRAHADEPAAAGAGTDGVVSEQPHGRRAARDGQVVDGQVVDGDPQRDGVPGERFGDRLDNGIDGRAEGGDHDGIRRDDPRGI